MVIATNLSFSKWASVFGDAEITTALLDRLTHSCHILETGNDSFRPLTKPLSKNRTYETGVRGELSVDFHDLFGFQGRERKDASADEVGCVF